MEEEEFDANLRGIMFMFLYFREKKEDVEEPILSTLLVSISLSFAICGLLILPINQIMSSFPLFVDWFGINGKRFSNSFALVSYLGSTFSLLIFNPFAFLYSEATDHTSWQSFYTTLLELFLLLFMLFASGTLYFTRSNVTQILNNPITTLSKLSSLLFLIPASFLYLRLGPIAIEKFVTNSLNSFVPLKRGGKYNRDEAIRLRQELETMREWSKKRRKNEDEEKDEDLIDEIQIIENQLKNRHPFMTNLKAIFFTGISSSFCMLILFCLISPNYIVNAVFSPYPSFISFILPFSFLSLLSMEFFHFASFTSFIYGEPNNNMREENKSKQQQRSRSDSIMSINNNALYSPISPARFTTHVLIFTTPSCIIISALFQLQVPSTIAYHPFFKNDQVISIYSLVFACRIIYLLFFSVLFTDKKGKSKGE